MMRVLIVEDERIAADRLETRLKQVAPEVQVLAKTTSVKQTRQWLSTHQADLIFMDIQLSDGLSFEIFRDLKIDTPIIFTTAYDQYAVEAFELNSVAYLLKPIKKKDLQKSLEKLHSFREAFHADFHQTLPEKWGHPSLLRKRFLVKIGERLTRINVEDVAYFYAEEKAVFLRRFDGKTYPLETTLDRLEQQLDPAEFFRINRKFLVHIDSISEMRAWSRNRVKLQLTPELEGEEAVVSVHRATDFKTWLNS